MSFNFCSHLSTKNIFYNCSFTFIKSDPGPQNQSAFFFFIEMNTSSESWINKLCYDRTMFVWDTDI